MTAPLNRPLDPETHQRASSLVRKIGRVEFIRRCGFGGCGITLDRALGFATLSPLSRAAIERVVRDDTSSQSPNPPPLAA